MRTELSEVSMAGQGLELNPLQDSKLSCELFWNIWMVNDSGSPVWIGLAQGKLSELEELFFYYLKKVQNLHSAEYLYQNAGVCTGIRGRRADRRVFLRKNVQY